jgi:hypothetical protein
MQASVTGLKPKTSYVLGLAMTPNGHGDVEPIATFTTNPTGSATANAVGPIRQLLQGDAKIPRRYLVITTGTAEQTGEVAQVQGP